MFSTKPPTKAELGDASKYRPITSDELASITSPPSKQYYALNKNTDEVVKLKYDGYNQVGIEVSDADGYSSGTNEIDFDKLPFNPIILTGNNPLAGYYTSGSYMVANGYTFYESVDPPKGGSKRKSRKTKRRGRRAKKTRSNRK